MSYPGSSISSEYDESTEPQSESGLFEEIDQDLGSLNNNLTETTAQSELLPQNLVHSMSKISLMSKKYSRFIEDFEEQYRGKMQAVIGEYEKKFSLMKERLAERHKSCQVLEQRLQQMQGGFQDAKTKMAAMEKTVILERKLRKEHELKAKKALQEALVCQRIRDSEIKKREQAELNAQKLIKSAKSVLKHFFDYEGSLEEMLIKAKGGKNK